MTSSLRALPFASFALLAAAVGCGTAETPRSALATDKKPTLVSVQTWQGQAACVTLEAVETPQQSQGDEGRKVTWSVCDARVEVVCESRASRGIVVALSRGEETVPQPTQCRIQVVGVFASSKVMAEPSHFQFGYVVEPGFKGSTLPALPSESHRVHANVSMPTTWNVMPSVTLVLDRHDAPGSSSVSVPLALVSAR